MFLKNLRVCVPGRGAYFFGCCVCGDGAFTEPQASLLILKKSIDHTWQVQQLVGREIVEEL